MSDARSSARDDFVNGLNVNPAYASRKRTIPLSGIPIPTGNVKGKRRSLTRPAVAVIVATTAVVCYWSGFVFAPRDMQVPGPVVYVTVPATTQPVVAPTAPVQPPSNSEALANCLKAVDGAKRILASGSRLASSTDKILDIISRANQAALSHDTRKLNAAVTDLRALAATLEHDKVGVMIPFQAIMDGLNSCPAS